VLSTALYNGMSYDYPEGGAALLTRRFNVSDTSRSANPAIKDQTISSAKSPPEAGPVSLRKLLNCTALTPELDIARGVAGGAPEVVWAPAFVFAEGGCWAGGVPDAGAQENP
jgi:hypothetical protein